MDIDLRNKYKIIRPGCKHLDIHCSTAGKKKKRKKEKPPKPQKKLKRKISKLAEDLEAKRWHLQPCLILKVGI